MPKRRVPVWTVLLICFLAIVAVMTVSSFWSQRAYQTFYVDFANEYSLLIRLIEVKDDVDKMYLAAWGLRNARAADRPQLEANYQDAHDHAEETIALLKSRLDGALYYSVVDIGNMVLTFDENYRDLVDNLETDYTLYLTAYERYLQRLKGYIQDEIRETSEKLTVKAKVTYDQFFERLDSIERRNNLLMILSTAVSLLGAAWRRAAYPARCRPWSTACATSPIPGRTPPPARTVRCCARRASWWTATTLWWPRRSRSARSSAS
jgi:hypothetical protein